MSNNRHRLYEGKVKASLLLKNLRSGEHEIALLSAKRFHILPQFSTLNPSEIISQGKAMRLKHALAVIALENGEPDWTSFKRKITEEDCLYPQTWSAHFNTWYVNYDEAKDHLGKTGGYLLSYRRHYFICEVGYIQALGLSQFEDEWERIGYDWVHPADKEAWKRLFHEAEKQYLARMPK
ncbi:MAG: hypothetical protein HYZ54_04520 [Ignavibacteriae bacterium]|nr:hypothetical protein [Ignavibacteriota bacterium]